MLVAKDSYYGVVDEIWELDYNSVVIPLLKCKWVYNKKGVKVHSDGFTCVNLSINSYSSDPFILAKQATQVFYVEDPKDKRSHIVLQSKRSIVGVDDVVDEDEYNKFDELPPFSIGVQSTDDDPPQPRPRRGINRIQDLPVGESVEFNQFGLAVAFDLLRDALSAIFGLSELKEIITRPGDPYSAATQLRGVTLSSTKSIGMKEQQGEQNESISTRQVNVPSSVQRRSNLSSTTSIIREEHQGEQNESISTRQVDVPSSVHRRSSLISTTSIVKLPCIKEETYCCLYIPSSVLAGEKVACATATVYPIGDGTVHFKKLLKGHMKVSVIKVVEIHKSMELPVPDDEIPNLESAVKGFIQWPIAAIARVQTKRVMPQHKNAPSTKKGKGNKTPKEPNKQDKALEETTKHQKTMQKIDEVEERVEKEKAANRKSLQALEDEVLSNRPQSVIDGYNKWMSRRDYAEPYAISVNKKVFRQSDESYFAINATDIIELLTYKELECGIVTLFEIHHYVLFIICPKHGMGFILNSSKGSNMNENVIGSLDLWSQWALLGGYYVMKWMHDFVLKYQKEKFQNVVPWSNERPLENKELNAIIGAWFTLWRD
ncbi:ulp1 protease family, C-terminal catalytic domain-containing protein [Tanacetum coccineum]